MLEGKSYVPLIYLRQSEMQALEELPTPTKNIIVPVVRIGPWLGSKTLARSPERVQKAFGERKFGFDLDALKRGAGVGDTAPEFAALFDESDGWKNYYEFLEAFSGAVPVLRSKGDESLSMELERVQSMDRGLFVRFKVGSQFKVESVAKAVVAMGIENVVFVLDCEWHAHLLPFQAQCVALLKLLSEIAPTAEYVVAGGDFPESGFDKGGVHFVIPGEERSLVEAVRRQVNEVEVFFGDWASARPPRVDSEIRRNRPRIDMPTRNGWECWRRPTPGKSYQEICSAAVTGRNLGQSSDLWGHQMIIATGSDTGATQIRAPNTAAAVRINLHMIMQAHFDTGSGPTLGDDLVIDEL